MQMCASILDVLGEHASALNLDSKLREEWLMSYIGIAAGHMRETFAN